MRRKQAVPGNTRDLQSEKGILQDISHIGAVGYSKQCRYIPACKKHPGILIRTPAAFVMLPVSPGITALAGHWSGRHPYGIFF